MKKRILSLFLTITVLIISAPTSAFTLSAETQTESYYSYKVENDTAIITGCVSGLYGNIEIPSIIDDYPVTAIWINAFKKNTRITGVDIPDSVTKIYESAFEGCSNLVSVQMPIELSSLGAYVFKGCNKLESIVIPEGVSSIGKETFSDCDTLTNISIPSTVKTIGEKAFYSCDKLNIVNIPASVEEIGKNAFKSIYNNITFRIKNIDKWCNIDFGYELTEMDFYLEENGYLFSGVNVPDGVTEIDYQFYKCSNLTEIYLPNSVTSIMDRAFSECKNLTRISVREDNINYSSDNGVLYTKNKTTLVIFPAAIDKTDYSVLNGVKNINAYAFYGNANLEELTIPSSVEKIGKYAFYGSKNQKKVNISDIAAWCNIEFSDFFSNPLSSEGMLYLNGSLVESIEFPNTVTKINDYAFLDCDSLTKITIPDAIEKIGKFAFCGSSNLADISINPDLIEIGEGAFSSTAYYNNSDNWENDVLYIGKHLICAKTSIAGHEVKEGTTTIANYAFSECESLATINIPNSMLFIGGYAFFGCFSLEDVVIPEKVKTIETCTFYGCESLVSVTLPKSIIKVAPNAFHSCPSLKDIYISDVSAWCKMDMGYDPLETSNFNPFGIEYNLYLNGELLTDLVIPDDVTCIMPIVFEQCNSIKSVTMSDSVTSIGAWAFNYAKNLEKVVLSNKLTTIEDFAFYECSSLSDISIPNSITSIGEYAFDDCAFTELVIPDTVERIGHAAFRGCDQLKKITLPFVGASQTENRFFSYIFGGEIDIDSFWVPKSLKEVVLTDKCESLGTYAFYDCENISSITLPNGISKIDDFTFYKCGLENISLPNDLEIIGRYAFANCTNLAKIDIPETVTTIDEFAFINCSSLKSIVIPKNVTALNWCSFEDCTNLKSVKIAEGTGTIGGRAFTDCSSLVEIAIPKTVTTVGEMAFENCTSLKYVFYSGTESQRQEIVIGATNNDALKDAIWHYNATGHAWYLEGTTPPTCKDGEELYKCSVCGLTEKKVLSAVGHPEEEIPAVPPTCTEGGSTAGIRCSACKETLVPPEPISAKGHTKVPLQAKVPTCTEDGCTEGVACSKCGEVLIARDPIDANGHNYDDGIITTNPTCKATGVKTYSCSVCKDTKTETIAKLTTHTYDNACDKTCNVCGKTRTVGTHKYSNSCDKTCKYCNAKRTIKHTYSNSCDTTCNVCKTKRTIKHTYTNNCDTSCNVCKATRSITHKYKTTTTKATLTKNGSVVKKCSVCGKVASKSTIKYTKTFKLSTTSYTYNGKVKTPSVTVKDSAGKVLKKNTDYTVIYASGRKNVGTYKVTIKMKGKYSGTKTLTFKINPAKTKVSKLTAGKKSITVAITKKSTQVTGYQIQYSTSKTFSKATTKTISSYKTTKNTLKSLSAKKTYYVRVRTYRTVGKTKYYSGWSTYKYVKTK